MASHAPCQHFTWCSVYVIGGSPWQWLIASTMLQYAWSRSPLWCHWGCQTFNTSRWHQTLNICLSLMVASQSGVRISTKYGINTGPLLRDTFWFWKVVSLLCTVSSNNSEGDCSTLQSKSLSWLIVMPSATITPLTAFYDMSIKTFWVEAVNGYKDSPANYAQF